MCVIVDLLLVLIVVLIVVLVSRGPSMLPQFGQALGRAVKGVGDNVNADAAQGDGPAETDAPDASSADDTDARPGA